MSNLSAWIANHALRTPMADALIYEGQTIRYSELEARVTAAAGWLSDMQVGAGARVALFMKNSAAFVEIAAAVNHLGAVLVPINFRLSPEEANYILDDSGAELLFVDAEFGHLGLEAPIVQILDAAAQRDITSVCPSTAVVDRYVPQSSELYRIMYTSGTTDRPKGVMHSYGNLLAKSEDQTAVLGLSPDSRLLVAGPLYHVGAFDLPGVDVLRAGGALCIHRDFYADSVLESIERHRLTCGWLAPVMTSSLIERAAAVPHDTSTLEWIIGGGEKTPIGKIKLFSETFPSARYIDAYGLTETCGGDTLMPAGFELAKIGSTGTPLPHVEISIRDDDGVVLPAGETGEICLRGAKVTAGYWNAPDKTASSFFDAWLRTGDVGHLDAEAFLFVTDRKKDMILSGGENIASSEVERVLLAMADIADAAVVGVADDRWGERPIAFVVLADGAHMGEEEIVQWCTGRLARFKVPDRIIITKTLPRSASGKILKRVLRNGAVL